MGKWMGSKRLFEGHALIIIAKTLKVSADLLLIDENKKPRQKSKLLGDGNPITQFYLSQFFQSDKIPEKYKRSIIYQIRYWLELHEQNNQK